MPTESIQKRLEASIDIIIKPTKHNALLPRPGTKSCYEQSARKGGALNVLNLYGIRSAQEMRDEQLHDREERIRSSALDTGASWADAELDDIWEIMEDNPEILSTEVWYDEAYETPRTYTEAFQAAVKDARNNRVAKILPIIQKDGKIRIATLHHSSVLWAARAMTAHLLPVLRKVAFSRAMLKDKKVTLFHPERNCIIYSADLSKSTDPISIGLARLVIARVVEKIGKPDWWDNAVNGTISPHRIEYNEQQFHTACGALMGLGPGWTVLNILNAFCAEDAGAPKGSYAVCGDDLIALWPASVIDKYEANIASIHLQSNKAKSFRSNPSAPYNQQGGVFCERFVRRTGEHTAIALPSVRLGEATGARALDGKKGLFTCDRLFFLSQNDPTGYEKTHRYLKREAYLTAKRTAATHHAGPLADGGGGASKANQVTVLRLFMSGPTPLTRFANDDRIVTLKDELRSMARTFDSLPPSASQQAVGPSKEGYLVCQSVAASEIILEARSEIESEVRLRDHNRTAAGQPLRYKNLKQSLCSKDRATRAAIRRAKGSIIRAIQEVKHPYALTTPTLLRKITNAVRHRRYALACRLIHRSWDQVVPLDQASTTFRLMFPAVQNRVDVYLTPTNYRWDSRTAS